MADITASMVKDLRDTTGAGMMDCKKALQETGGDIAAAADLLRVKGLAKAAKKADRVASEGAVVLALRDEGAGMTGALIELNSETDFVARNETFQTVARKLAGAALDAADVEALRAAPIEDHASVSEMVTTLVATIGENMLLRRAAAFSVSPGAVGGYVHNKLPGAPDLGRMGVLVALESTGDQTRLKELAYSIAMHVAGTPTPPLALTPDQLDADTVAHEKAIYTEQAAESGKPPNVVEKMVEGRLRKWMEERLLLKQPYVRDGDLTIEQLVAAAAKQLGAPIKVVGFVRLALGEGVEKPLEEAA